MYCVGQVFFLSDVIIVKISKQFFGYDYSLYWVSVESQLGLSLMGVIIDKISKQLYE